MNWKNFFFLTPAVVIIFLIQQSFFINFYPLNLLLLLVIWLGFRQRSESLLVALTGGILLDSQTGVLGPAILSFCLINYLIIYLSKHISLEGFIHFLLVSFMGLIIFLASYYLWSNVFNVWLMKQAGGQTVELNWLKLVKIILVSQLLLIIGYLLTPKANLKYEKS
jgi:hypothetical protein